MNLRRALPAAGALLAIVAVLSVFVFSRRERAASTRDLHSAPSDPPTSFAPTATSQAARSGGSKIATPVQSPGAPAERSTLADSLNSPSGDIQADLRIVLEVITSFQTNFPRDGNPVGTNAEITAVLTGRNRLRLALIPPDHPAINSAGELCDRWGTPFFFHAESARQMEIRSAGPDKKMWNQDDTAQHP